MEYYKEALVKVSRLLRSFCNQSVRQGACLLMLSFIDLSVYCHRGNGLEAPTLLVRQCESSHCFQQSILWHQIIRWWFWKSCKWRVCSCPLVGKASADNMTSLHRRTVFLQATSTLEEASLNSDRWKLFNIIFITCHKMSTSLYRGNEKFLALFKLLSSEKWYHLGYY